MISNITMMKLLFTAIGQIMLYVDGMNGVINHSDTIQWLYSLTASRVRNYTIYIYDNGSGWRYSERTRLKKPSCQKNSLLVQIGREI